MATLTTGRRKALELTPAERVRLADTISAAMDRLGYNLPAAARATTLSGSAIRRLRSDRGEGEGTRIFLYTWVYLCDGLQIDPAELAESMGVTLDPSDLATSHHGLVNRRRQRGDNGGGRPMIQRRPRPTEAAMGDDDLMAILLGATRHKFDEVLASARNASDVAAIHDSIAELGA